MNPIQLTPADLAIAALLVVVDGILSVALRLGLARQLAIAAARMVVQLVLIGYLLRFVFAVDAAWLTLLLVAVMIAIAAREVAARPKQRLVRGGNWVAGGSAVALATGIASILALTTALRPQPWYDPRYAIPLAGIILGNALSAASLSLDGVLDGVVRERAAIEARLCLGATIGVAMGGLVRSSIRRGLLPIINAMSASGIVTLPGIMTGQILAGLDPLQAVKYQILLMFLLSGGAGLAAAVTALVASRLLTDNRQRLRLDRLRTRR